MALAGMAAGCGNRNSDADGVAAIPGPMKTATIDLAGGVKMEFVLIPAGSFMMGSDTGNTDEKPVHKVTLTKPFYLGKFEVTQKQWKAVMGSNPSRFKGPKRPVECVSWDDCQILLTRLQVKLPGRKFALPTEAQWEYACRAGSAAKYSYGDDKGTLGEYAWFVSNSGSATHPVGEKKPNGWGLHDMHGNVLEWCADWYCNSYPKGDAFDPQGPSSGTNRVFRSGAWSNYYGNLRSSYRDNDTPDIRYDNLGLRCVMVMGEASP